MSNSIKKKCEEYGIKYVVGMDYKAFKEALEKKKKADEEQLEKDLEAEAAAEAEKESKSKPADGAVGTAQGVTINFPPQLSHDQALRKNWRDDVAVVWNAALLLGCGLLIGILYANNTFTQLAMKAASN